MRNPRARQRIQTKAGTVIDGTALRLSDWLALVFDPPDEALIADWQFPTDTHRREYIETIETRPEQEVRRLLRKFLIPSGGLGTDRHHLAFLKTAPASARLELLQTEYCRRLILSAAGSEEVQPWEGITWVLDLCSWYPKAAIEALSAYLLAHAQLLPDGRYVGLQDALQIIRARYIGTPSTNSEKLALLMELTPRQFECVVERT
jgi:restriction system protein